MEAKLIKDAESAFNNAPREILLPMLATMGRRLLSDHAKATAPPIKTVISNARAPTKVFVRMYRELLQGYLHEEGHARVMRHLDPTCTPEIRVNVEPTLNDDGLGVAITGGACGSTSEFEDPRERIMVSYGGWLAETKGLGQVMDAGGHPYAGLFAALDAATVATLWAGDDFAKTFTGCASDHHVVRHSAREWFPKDADPEDPDQEEEINAAATLAAERLFAAMDAAMRIIEAQAEEIVQVATDNAQRHLAVIVASLEGMAPHVDAMRAAAVGAFTPEAAAALKANGRAAPKRVWENDDE